MNIIDITGVCNEDIEIIGVYDDMVYYFKGLTMDSECNIEVYYYDRQNAHERKIVFDCIHTTEFYDKEVTTYQTYAEVVFKNGSRIEVFRIDFIENKIDKLFCLDVDSKSFNGVKTLGDRYAMVFTDKSDIDSDDFNQLLDMNGYYESGYLYDSIAKSKYKIFDSRLILSLKENLLHYNYKGNEYVIFEEVYMEPWRLEDMYIINSDKSFYARHSYRDSINIILLDDLVKQIKEGREFIDMVQVYSTEMNGWTRYFGMDDEHIYFRSKNFKSGREDIYKVFKNDFTVEKMGEIDHNKYPKGNVRYDKCCQRVTLDYPHDQEIKVKGLYNFPHETTCSNGIGMFIETANENCIVATYWREGENQELIDCVGIKDLLKGKVFKFEGIAHIERENIVIYK